MINTYCTMKNVYHFISFSRSSVRFQYSELAYTQNIVLTILLSLENGNKINRNI